MEPLPFETKTERWRISLRLGIALRTGLALQLGMALLLASGSALAKPRAYQLDLRPEWSEDGRRFWYQRDLPGSRREFILVDAESGTRMPAFDHERLADSLSVELSRKVSSDRLPVESLSLLGTEAIEVHGSSGSWQVDLESYELRSIETAARHLGLPFDLNPRPSVQSGADTEITFINRWTDEVRIFWSDGSGGRHLYATLEPGQRYPQHTFQGHVWIVVGPEDELLAVFEGPAKAGVAIIDGRDPAPGVEGDTSAEADATDSADPDDPGDPADPSNGTASGERLDGIRTPSPDGTWSAFARDGNLWIRNEVTGQERAASTDGSLDDGYQKNAQRERLVEMQYDAEDPPTGQVDVTWAPDSRHLIALRSQIVPEKTVHMVEAAPDDQLQPRLHSYTYLKPGDEIPVRQPRLFDAQGGREIEIDARLFPNPWGFYDYQWTGDGTRCYFIYNPRGHEGLRVIEVSVPGGETRVVVDETTSTFVDYSSKTYLHHLESRDQLIWMSERSGWNHLYLYDRSTGKVVNAITEGEWLVRNVERVNEDDGRVWFQAMGIVEGQDPYLIHFCRVDLDGSNLVVLTGADEGAAQRLSDSILQPVGNDVGAAPSPSGFVPSTNAEVRSDGVSFFDGHGTHEIELSPDARFFIDSWSRVDQPTVHVLRETETGRIVCPLEVGDASEFVAEGRRFAEPFVAKGRDGVTDIHGIIQRPKDFDPSLSYPVVEEIYAGPHGHHVPKRFRVLYGNRSLTDRGFIVVQIDGMGTNWRSKAFHDVAWKNLIDGGFPDRIAWMKAAAAKYPYMDLTRVGIYGGSAGGQNALAALLTHPEFYKVGVADCGCHDNRMDKVWWNEQWMGYPVGPHYAEQSNVTLAERLEGKLLLTVGELDRNVDPASTLQVVKALIDADKDFEMLVMPGVGHGAGGTEYGRRRREEFFERHLLGDEARD